LTPPLDTFDFFGSALPRFPFVYST
jgi:hypothetical protein